MTAAVDWYDKLLRGEEPTQSLERPKPTNQQLNAIEAKAKYNGKLLRWELAYYQWAAHGVVAEDLKPRGWESDHLRDVMFRTRGF